MVTDKIEVIRGRLAVREHILTDIMGSLEYETEATIYCSHVRTLLEEIDRLKGAIEDGVDDIGRLYTMTPALRRLRAIAKENDD